MADKTVPRPYDSMTDEEIVDLGRATLQGDLPRDTAMRLFLGACRLLDEKRTAQRALNEIKQSISAEATAAKRQDPVEALADMLPTIARTEQRAAQFREEYDEALNRAKESEKRVVAFQRENDLLEQRCAELERRLISSKGDKA